MPQLSDFQALLFDIDNTLTNSHKEITIATQAALTELQQLPLNLQTVVCTGRIFASLKNYAFPYFPIDAIHIIAGGAQIVRTNGEVLWEKLIPDEISRPLCQKLLAVNAQFFISQNQQMIATPVWQAEIAQGNVPVDLASLTDLTHWTTPIIGIRIVTDEVRQIVSQFPELTVKEMASRHGGTYFDLTLAGVNKATALVKWSELTSIPITKIIGFGDSSNDLEFLTEVGFSVAMGNAIPSIQAIAKRTIGHTDADGLAVYLRQISQGAQL